MYYPGDVVYICNNMDSKRQQKYAKLIQKDISEILRLHFSHLYKGGLVTVTLVKMSPDLGQAKIYLSLLGIKNIDQFFEELEEKRSEVRKILGNKIGKQVRKIPELAFYHDNIEEEARRVDKLIDNLNIPPETDPE